jgi:methionyl-tRNA formyltransferase
MVYWQRRYHLRQVLLCGTKEWTRTVYQALQRLRSQVTFHHIERREDLLTALSKVDPEYIFFLHWHWEVPCNILEKHECVGFHAAPLPKGRGGSPIQNQILEGVENTTLSVFKMTNVMDGGPIYTRLGLPLDGPLHKILRYLAYLATETICWMLKEHPEPTIPNPDEQMTLYTRRRTNELPLDVGLVGLYNHIRMLDAPGQYDPVECSVGKWKLQFSDAHLCPEGHVEARVCITESS